MMDFPPDYAGSITLVPQAESGLKQDYRMVRYRIQVLFWTKCR